MDLELDPVEEFESLRKRVCEVYTQRRRRFESRWTPSSRWKQFWDKVATVLQRRHCDDVEGYIEAQFQYQRPFPQPNMMHSQAAWANYEDYLKKSSSETGDEWAKRVAYEIEHAKVHQKIYASEEEMLGCWREPLSPLFRVCRLTAIGGDMSQMFDTLREARSMVKLKVVRDAYAKAGLLTRDVLEVLGMETR